MSPGNYRYPEVKSPLRRQVHAPSRSDLSTMTRQMGRDRSTRQVSGNPFGAFRTTNYDLLKRNALDLHERFITDRQVIGVDDELGDTSMEGDVVENVAMEVDEVEEKAEMRNGLYSEVVNMKNGSLMVDDDGSQANSSLLNRPVTDVTSFEAYRKLLESAENRTSKLKVRGCGDVLKDRVYALLRSLFSFWKQNEEPVEVWLFPLNLYSGG